MKAEHAKRLDFMILIIFEKYPISQDDLFNKMRKKGLLPNGRNNPFWKKLKSIYYPLINWFIDRYVEQSVAYTKNNKNEEYSTNPIYWAPKKLNSDDLLRLYNNLKHKFSETYTNKILATKWGKESGLQDMANIVEKHTAEMKKEIKQYLYPE